MDTFINLKINPKVNSNLQETDEEMVVGIDEAGRGPVVGPMVYGVYLMPKEKTKKKSIRKYFDSKRLTHEQRTNLYKNMSHYAYVAIDPMYITMCMEHKIKNLNTIAKDAVVMLLKEVQSKYSNAKSIYVDGLGNNSKYKEYLLERFPDCDFTIENKADATYEVVSGASIVAKVNRDKFLADKKLQIITGKNLEQNGYFELNKYGSIEKISGYPSDPNTVKWLKNNIYPISGTSIKLRGSWGTIKNNLGKRKTKPLKKNPHFYLSSE